jgi:hypothetical protein
MADIPGEIVMPHSRLHAAIAVSDEERLALASALKKKAGTKHNFGLTLGAVQSHDIPIGTLSKDYSFDAQITVGIGNAQFLPHNTLIVDSGNSSLVMPYYEDFQNLAGYTDLGDCTEPFQTPARMLRGPILLNTTAGVLTIPDCVFYACKGPGARVSNFGTGRISPWGLGLPATLPAFPQAPLSYLAGFPFAEFNFEPLSQVMSATSHLKVAASSLITLYAAQPPGYTMFAIKPDYDWMALSALDLKIDGAATGWPDRASVAFIDTGGTCVNLSDPGSPIWNKQWKHRETNPPWTSAANFPSTNVQTIADPLTITLGDGTSTYTYTLDPSQWPASVAGQTLVACEIDAYMMQQTGMNIGGISALVNSILIDYAGARVGFKPKPI